MSRVVRGLNGPDMRHSVCCLKGEPEIGGQFDSSVDIHCLRAPHRDRLLWVRLRALIRRLRPTVVHARNWICWPDAAMARLTMLSPPPLIMSFHGFHDARAFPWRRRMEMRTLPRLAACHFTVSEGLKDMLVRDVGLRGRRICVIPNGVDENRFRPARLEDIARRRALAAANDVAMPPMTEAPRAGLAVGSAGWLHPVKNHQMLIHAAKKLIAGGLDLTVRIAGRGEMRDRLAAAIGPDMNDRIQLLGHVQDMPAFLSGLDVFVLPSDAEGMPNALLEAMACGLPCIATRVGGVVEILDDGKAGVLVAPRDADGLAAAIQALAADPIRRRSLGQLACERVRRRYSLERMIRRYDLLYRHVAAGKSVAPQTLEDL